MSAGRRRAEVPSKPSPLFAAPPLIGAVVAAAVWLGLVVLAVHLGRASSWVLAVVTTVVAVGCLLVVFALVRRTWAVLHGSITPPRPAGRRRR